MRCGDEAYSYDAYGNQTGEAEDSNPFRYAGEYWDSESGLIYLRARYYDSGVGAFTSADTHWNAGNMIYGDDNTGIPSIAAILQSGNLYVYCMGNPVTYWDPSGNSARITLGSLQSALEQGVSAFEIRDAYYLQVGSNSLAVEYAQNHNPQYVDGKLKTWANEADAYRHFTWNYKMVKKMNYDKALKISSAHEIAFLREHKVIVYVTDSSSTLRNAFMTLENLMDIWNNSRAVDTAASGMYSSAEAAFQALLNNGDLITSPDQVAAKYGFDPSKMTTGINNINGFNVTLDYKNGYLYSGSIWLQGTRRQ